MTTIDDYTDKPEQHLPPHIGVAGVVKNLTTAGLEQRVSVVEGDSRTVPPWLHQIGLLWIDSTHTAEHVTAELVAWLPHVIVCGIVAFHDYGGANTPQLKDPIDDAFSDRSVWQKAAAYYTVIGFKRLR